MSNNQEAIAMTNAITRVEIEDFLVFKGKFSADFCSGVNVLIGGNGTGKTTLLRVLTFAVNEKGVKRLNAIAYGNAEDILYDVLLPQIKKCVVKIDGDEHPNSLSFMPSYIDANFMIKTNRKIDDISDISKTLMKKISEISKIQSTDTSNSFRRYVERSDIGKILLELEASGFQKLALLFQMLSKGWLENGSVLLWDEPENSLNPELIPVLVDILLELSRNSVQIFVATHSYDIARWFELNKTDKNSLRYFNLRKEDGGIVEVHADEYTELEKSVLRDADNNLLKAVMSKSMGVTE
jgi:predicted ATPase